MGKSPAYWPGTLSTQVYRNRPMGPTYAYYSGSVMQIGCATVPWLRLTRLDDI
jgi:hypothetical protein